MNQVRVFPEEWPDGYAAGRELEVPATPGCQPHHRHGSQGTLANPESLDFYELSSTRRPGRTDPAGCPRTSHRPVGCTCALYVATYWCLSTLRLCRVE